MLVYLEQQSSENMHWYIQMYKQYVFFRFRFRLFGWLELFYFMFVFYIIDIYIVWREKCLLYYILIIQYKMTQVCRYFLWNHQLQYFYFYGEANVVPLSFKLFSCVWSKGVVYVSHFSINLQKIYFKLCTNGCVLLFWFIS